MFNTTFNYLIYKISLALTYILFPFARAPYKFYTKYYFINVIIQLKYFWKDYIVKRPYKIIKYDSEFGPELKFVVPFAFWHYKNGTLLKTVSSKGTKEIYYFSPDHEEKYEKRIWSDFNFDIEIPNTQDHSLRYSLWKWEPVSFKERYKTNIFNFNKPVLIIANRYNSEWNNGPISFLDINILIELVGILSNRFTIIYNRPDTTRIINDNSDVFELGEKAVLRQNYSGKVILMDDLFEKVENQFDSFNHFQLCIYSLAEKFISVHGGTSVLASYFSGINIIYSVTGHEHETGEFTKFYPLLSDAQIFVARDYKSLIDLVSDKL